MRSWFKPKGQPSGRHLLEPSTPTTPGTVQLVDDQALITDEQEVESEFEMSNIEQSLKQAMTVNGAIGTALVDYTSGMCLGTTGGGEDFDLEIAAAGNTEVVRAKLATMKSLGLKDTVEDILITLGTQTHLIRVLAGANCEGLFLYLALDRSQSNLALARRELSQIEKTLVI
jgi:hypothetical protein